MPTKPPIPDYAAKAYELCDILDELAEKPAGELLADALAGRMLGMAAKAYPREAARVLGDGPALALVIAYKAVNDTDLIDQVQTALTTIPTFRAALQQLLGAATAPPVKPSATVTEKAAPGDPFAAAIQTDIRHINWGGNA